MILLENSTKQIIEKLPINFQQFAMCRISTPIKNIKSPNAIKKICKDILCKASFDMGSPMSGDLIVLELQTEALYGELNGKFTSLTMPEIGNAFKMGIRGEFGSFFGLCAKTYHQFIKSYYEHAERHKAIEAYAKLLGEENKPAELTEEQKLEIGKQGAIKRFNDYKETGQLGFMPSATYTILNSILGTEIEHPILGKIKTLITDSEVRKILVTEVKTKFIEDTRMKKTKARFSLDKELLAVYDHIISNWNKQPKYETMLKERMLKYYFDELINNNKNLEL